MKGLFSAWRGKTQEGITAGYKMGAGNTCSSSSFAFSPVSRDPPGHHGGGSSVGFFSAEMN